MRLVGKYTTKTLNRQGDLIDLREDYNVITFAGRQRLLDIWSMNYDTDTVLNKQFYGYEFIDLTPSVLGNGQTQKSTFFGTGRLPNPKNENTTGQTVQTDYNGWLTLSNVASEVDNVLLPANRQTVMWSGGPVDNSNYNDNYFHYIDFCRVDTLEQVTIDYPAGSDFVFKLYGNKLKYDIVADKQYSCQVKNELDTVTYVYNTDYVVDRESGLITFKAGRFTNGQVVNVRYIWHALDETGLLDDGVIGIYQYCYPRVAENALYHRSAIGKGRYSENGGENWRYYAWPWTGRPQTPAINYHTNNNDYINANLANFRATNSEYERYYFTQPYVFNKPTTFTFQGLWSYSPLYMRNFLFIKPRCQPQTPQVIALGTGSSVPNAADTSLGSEIFRKNINYFGRPENGVARWKAYIDYEECNGYDISEVGLFFGDQWKNSNNAGWTYFAPIKKENCNQLFSRALYDNSWVKTSDQMVELTYEILFA